MESTCKTNKLSDQTSKVSVVQAMVSSVTEPTSSTTGTTLLYCRSGIITQAVKQQSSVQSAKTTVDLKPLDDSTSLPIGHNLHQGNMESSCRKRKLSDQDNDVENDSIWLFKVLDNFANDDYRKMCQEGTIAIEIMGHLRDRDTIYHVGSTTEGTSTPGMISDKDVIRCDERLPVIEDISNADKKQTYFLIVRELETPAGYVKLQLVFNGEPCMSDLPWVFSPHKSCFKTDKLERIVLCDLITKLEGNCPFVSREKNKPSAKVENFYHYNADTVVCYQCKTWPAVANEWLSRRRCYGWPSQKTIDELKSLGFFVVRKGHPFSQEDNLEWRISLTLQERKLMLNLTDVQYKSYVVLKMLNRDVLHLDCITTYHWKTCLFYMMEENEPIVWKNKRLFHCVTLCIKQMLEWVKRGCCPNYFIPGENLFDGRMNDSLKIISEKKLTKLLNAGFAVFLQVKSDNICDYVESRNNLERYECLQAKSLKANQKSVYEMNAQILKCALYCLSYIFRQYKAKGKDFIKYLWKKLYYIQHVETIYNHTQEETQRALFTFQPFIYTCLASNISAMCIHQQNPQVRAFLLSGCYTFFLKGDLSGRLKFISVLYAVGCYKECEWFLEQEDEESIKTNPSVCNCHHIPSTMNPNDDNFAKISRLKMSTCLVFLPTELTIIPDALKFEIFRFIGISSHQSERENSLWCWHYWAVVDSNIYYFFLKFLLNLKFKEDRLSEVALDNMMWLIRGSNVRHRDVSFNLVAWCISNFGMTHDALDIFKMSWNETVPSHSLFMFFTKEMKQRHYQFKSAKLHVLVVLYNIWFTRNPSVAKFCFQCFVYREGALRKCSRCKTAKYCSTQCQRINWTVHKAICKIVNKYHHV